MNIFRTLLQMLRSEPTATPLRRTRPTPPPVVPPVPPGVTGPGASGPKLKARPGGAYCLLPGGQPQDSATLADPDIPGHRARYNWTDLQPNLGAIDLTKVQTLITLAKAVGKKFTLGVAAGVWSPDEIYTKGAFKCPLSPDGITIEKANPWMTLPWDPVFQSYWFPMIAALGKLLDPSPECTAIVVSGMMQQMENRLVLTDADFATADAHAKKLGYPDAIVAYQVSSKLIIEKYFEAFPTTTIYLTTARVFPSIAGDQSNNILRDAVRAIHPGRFGTMPASRHATLPPHDGNPNGPSPDPKGSQAIFSTEDRERLYQDGTPNPWPPGEQPVVDLLSNSRDLGDEYFELYRADWKNPLYKGFIKPLSDQIANNRPPMTQ